MAATLLAAPLAAQDAPVVAQGPSSYSLRPGDIIRIGVWGQDAYSGQFQIDEEGLLHYPIIGELNTRDMSLAALRDTVRAGLERLFTNPFVTITPLFRIAVLGQVLKPGLYTVDPTLSVLDIVALAGGATPAGNLEKIKLYRGGAESNVNYEQTALVGHTLQQVGVRSGDEIMVPRKSFTREDWSIVLAGTNLALTAAIFVVTLLK